MAKENPKSFFSESQRQAIVEAIQRAEAQTSGEIRVHLTKTLPGDGIEAASKIFNKLGMAATREKSGVLFVMGIQDHRLVLLGDSGIHERVPPDFWKEVTEEVLGEFRAGRFVDGLQKGIAECGERLKAHFPRQAGDQDELSNELSHDSE